MKLLYNTGLFLFAFGIRVAALFNAKARLFVKGRRGIFARLADVNPEGVVLAWFHCASLGEFEQGRPVMDAYRKNYPHHKLLLTFFSPSGYEVRKNYEGADYVFYLPIDTPRNARRFINAVKPVVAVFIKYEFWYNYLHGLKKREVPTYIVSAIFRPSQLFFKSYGGFFRKMLHTYRTLFVQDEASVELLKKIGVEQVVVSGDTRFDRVHTHTRQPAALPIVANFTEGKTVIVAGSTWLPDDQKLAELWPRMPENISLVVAPHDVGEERVAEVEKLFGHYNPVRYTKAENTGFSNDNKVLIIDTIGILMSAYSYGQIAYIGGGFSHTGIHNTLEAAAYGMPVVFGPKYKKYVEAADLVRLGGAVSVDTVEDLAGILLRWIQNPTARRAAGDAAATYVERSRGATEKVMEWL